MRGWAKAVAVVVGLALAIFVAMLAYDAWATRGTVSVHNGLYYSETVPFTPPSPPPCVNSTGSALSPLFSTSFHGVLFAFAYGTTCPSGDPALQAVGTGPSGQVHVHTFVRPRLGNVWFSPDSAFGIRIGSGTMTLYSRFDGFLFLPQIHLGLVPLLTTGGWVRSSREPPIPEPSPRPGPDPGAARALRTRGEEFRGLPRSGSRSR